MPGLKASTGTTTLRFAEACGSESHFRSPRHAILASTKGRIRDHASTQAFMQSHIDSKASLGEPWDTEADRFSKA